MAAARQLGCMLRVKVLLQQDENDSAKLTNAAKRALLGSYHLVPQSVTNIAAKQFDDIEIGESIRASVVYNRSKAKPYELMVEIVSKQEGDDDQQLGQSVALRTQEIKRKATESMVLPRM